MRGNTVMRGYLKNPRATQEAFAGGWFHTGDLGVMHPNGYIEVKDRLKDIIISGGENISTIEVEAVLYRHPAVLEAGVVARTGREMGRDAVRVHHLERRGTDDRGGDHRLLPREPGSLQGAENRDLRTAAKNLDRKAPEVQTARSRKIALRRSTKGEWLGAATRLLGRGILRARVGPNNPAGLA